MATMTDERELTVIEVAARSGFHPDTIRKAVKNGRLPARLFGGHKALRIAPADYERWMAEGAPTSPAPEPTKE